ncbi:MAG: M1 family metallopeptidase, partial [Planctomycetes bacterium]|nr:M1 family metallopeptidase [Planctomycetota bacterium]
IHYATSPEARALQWLTKEQTAGGKQPFLYTQGQAILTRSWVPLQDSPGVRMTYAARVRAPQGLRVVMSAGERGTDGAVFTFAMRDRIPPYLIALACGDLAFAPISARCGVFADPSVLAGAKQELGDMETMVQKCEQYFGAYRWGRYDVLIMPPAFPFGGMENPTLTFATPTILVGDKSQVALIAHELAHSWSGNLVTNATWRDFWLNEGFTVFLEQRIMELVFGKERAAMEIATGDAGLRKEIAELPAKDQVLHIDLTGRNPDDAMTAIAYDKGAAFLRRLEAVFGRDAMDRFLSAYFSAHAFQSITTETFLKFLDQHLLQSDPARKKKVDVHAWVFEPGLPKSMPELHPRGFAEVEAFRTAWLATGKMPADAKPGTWITHQWLHFLAGLQSDPDVLRRVDQRFGLASSPNGEIRSAFLTRALELHLFDFVSHTMDFVSQVGRRKLVLPLVKALMSHKDKSGEPHAREILVRFGPRFHFITRRSIEQLVDR